jgi:hypothetical protein
MTMSELRYTRVVADSDGESHFDDVAMTLAPVDFAPPAAPLDFVALGAATNISVIGGDAGWKGDTFHRAPARQFMLLICGRCSVTVSDGETRSFSLGDIVLLEDVHGKGHMTTFTNRVQIAVVRLTE